ncbi:MAG: MarR family transcriptional regulator [Microbispora sp.]|nr:MarR family transcriptional regulator [Microbispora sp.]
MATPSRQESLGILIGQVARRWRSRLDRRLEAFGLTEARWLTLIQLARGGSSLTQKDLAARVGVEAATLVRTLDRLEEEGLVVRREAGGDRRAKTVHLSDRAAPVLHLIEETAAALRTEVLAGVSEAELEACHAVIERIAANLAADHQAGGSGRSDGHRAA